MNKQEEITMRGDSTEEAEHVAGNICTFLKLLCSKNI